MWKHFLDILWNSDKFWRSFSANRLENCKSVIMLFDNLWKIAKIRDEILLNCWRRRGAKECKSDRSRQEQSLSMSLFLNLLFEPNSYSNEYLLFSNIYLQTLASIQPRKSPVKFAFGPALTAVRMQRPSPWSQRVPATAAESLGSREGIQAL